MILLISASTDTAQCVEAVGRTTGEQVQLAATLREGMAAVKGGEFAVVMVDQALVDPNPSAVEAIWKHTGTAIPLVMNFAICGVERVVREIRATVQRRMMERRLAEIAAKAELRNELSSVVTGILLTSELALAQPSVPPEVAEKLEAVHELALKMRSQLGEAA